VKANVNDSTDAEICPSKLVGECQVVCNGAFARLSTDLVNVAEATDRSGHPCRITARGVVALIVGVPLNHGFEVEDAVRDQSDSCLCKRGTNLSALWRNLDAS